MKQRIPRRALRYPVRLKIKEINGQPVAETFLVDLSSLGARLESPTPLAPRNHMEFIVFLPDAETPTRLSGSVIWMKPVVTAPGRYLMGLKFFNSVWHIDQLGRNGKL